MQISDSAKESEPKNVNYCTRGINFCRRYTNMDCQITFFCTNWFLQLFTKTHATGTKMHFLEF